MTEYTFYKLECIDGTTDDTYVGSTNNLFKRQTGCKAYVKDVYKLDKKHTCMRMNGGFNNWRWIILETGLYALELHAHVREQQLIDLHKPTLNTLRAYQTLEQRREQINANQKKYDDANRDTIHAYQKIYKAANRNTINANRRAKAAAKRALLLQPVLSVVDEPADETELGFI